MSGCLVSAICLQIFTELPGSSLIVYSYFVLLKEILDLMDNEVYGSIPTEFGSLQDMEILRLGGNLLTGNIPTELADMTNLQALYLHANE